MWTGTEYGIYRAGHSHRITSIGVVRAWLAHEKRIVEMRAKFSRFGSIGRKIYRLIWGNNGTNQQ